MNNNEVLTPFGEQMRDFENIYKEKRVKTTGWKAKSMPIVFWAVPTKDWTDNPRIAEGMEAEVTLPNGQIVVVEEIRYQGINDGNHHWQGSLSRSGKASAYHTAFNCVPCGTNTCRLPQNKRLEAVLGRES